MASPITRFIQLSDTHLASNAHDTMLGVNTHESFQRVVEMLCADSFTPDFLILTGDVSQKGSDANSYRKVTHLLKNLPYPIYWLAGNHDDIEVMTQVFAGVFDAAKTINTPNQWQIILLNSSVPHSVSGKLSPAELKHFSTCLQKSDYQYSLVFLHHHPIAIGCEWLDPLGLTNAAEFFKIAKSDQRVKAIAWGHAHQVHESEEAGVRYLSAPSTCWQFLPHSKDFKLDVEKTPGYRCFELHADGTIKTWVKRLEHFSAPYDLDAKGY